jgi:ribosomal protein S18 acetylase RimI-like enzyme
MMTSIQLITTPNPPLPQLLALYNAVGWTAYTRDEAGLEKAVRNSTYVVCAWDGEKLVGLARCLSDDASIFYLQDILVHPGYQRRGIGRRLMENCLECFAHVRTKVLLTDDEERQHTFYKSLGYKNTRELKKIPLNAFVQMNGIDLA